MNSHYLFNNAILETNAKYNNILTLKLKVNNISTRTTYPLFKRVHNTKSYSYWLMVIEMENIFSNTSIIL